MSEYDKIADRATHTSGPWVWRRDYEHRNIYGSDTRMVATTAGVAHDAKEIHANANLITAAPDLLAALEGMQTAKGCFDDCRWEYSGRHRSICLEARAAIAKARGSV